MFVDHSNILVKAGKGGDGAVSFRREKFVAAGGPDGGDGGKGGDVYFMADKNLTTLSDFKYKRKFLAQDGEDGKGKKAYGKGGEDLLIRVPIGTLVYESKENRLIADISEDGKAVLIAKGGRGGWGNTRFSTATRQIPRFSKPGAVGKAYNITLELKLLADVGLVGFPNVGKSTLISVLTGAKPKIANYHFTTLIPNLGVVEGDSSNNHMDSYVIADIPGLIEGAADGVGLGHDFLRHVERCRLIVHIVDISGIEGRDPKEDFVLINRELKKFSEDLVTRPQIVLGNKLDIASKEQVEDFESFVREKGYDFLSISAVTTQGIGELKKMILQKLSTLPPTTIYTPDVVEVEKSKERTYEIKKENNIYYIEAEWLVEILDRSDMEDYESLQYFQRTLLKSGIVNKLEEMEINEGDLVNIHGFEFNFMP